jgi:hypothetical protein
MATSLSSITRKQQIVSLPIELESDVKRQCFTVWPTTMTTNTTTTMTNASIHPATSRPATPWHTASTQLISDSKPVESLASCGSWLGPNSDGEDRPHTRRVFNDFFDPEPTSLRLRTVFDFNSHKCQMVLATLEGMENRLRGSDLPVVPWITAPLRQFPSQPSYFWLMHWKTFVDEEMEKVWAM